MVTGEKGWLPYGTDCSGEDKREAYCVKVRGEVLWKQVYWFIFQGRCLEFGSDGTPLYVAVPGGSLENQGDHFIFKRSLKEGESDIEGGVDDSAGGSQVGGHSIFKRSLILNSTSRVAGSIDQEYLEQIVNDFNRSLTHDEAEEEATVNFDDPIDVAELPLFDNEELVNEADYNLNHDIEGDLDNSDDFPVDFDIIYDKPTSGAAFTKGAIFIVILVSSLVFSRSNSFYFLSSKTHHRNKSRNANQIS